MKTIRCGYCNSNKAEFLYAAKDRMIRRDSAQEFYLYQCKECGLAYLHPQPSWSELEYFYGGDYYTNIAGAEIRHNFFYNFLRKLKRVFIGPPNPKFWNFGKEKGKFLDVGCGNAAYEAYIIRNYPGWEFYGVEPNRSSAELAKKIPSLKVFEGFLEDARYENDFFDVILMSHSLEHSASPLVAIKESYRILKPGGHLVIKVPNFNSPSRRLFGKYWYHLDAPRHLFHFNAKVLSRILKEAGFKVASVKFEVLSGSVMRSIAYIFNRDKFLFEKPLILPAIYYLMFPINKLVELLQLGSGLRIIARKD